MRDAKSMSRAVKFQDRLWIAPQSIVVPPTKHFFCLLDKQPDYLVPMRFLRNASEGEASDDLIVNPLCWFSRTGFPPPEVTQCLPLPDKFATGIETVWVGDPGMRTITPFWLGRRYSALLSGFRPGDAVTVKLTSRERYVLTATHVLIAPNYLEQRRQEWHHTLLRCRSLFKKGYSLLSGSIHPFHLGALRTYYRHLVRKGKFRLGDGQSSKRYVSHNEGVARFYHHQLTSVMSDIAERPVKPSYVYFASYQSGAELPRHTDREQCEYSITLCIDHSPESTLETSWPLYLETDNGVVVVYQGLADALLYRGRLIPHYRNKLPDGHTSTFIFFHYVNEDFTGSLE
jgi:hypothetical protein